MSLAWFCRPHGPALLAGLAWMLCAQAQQPLPQRAEPMLAALNQARQAGCQGRPGSTRALAPEPRLQRAAERMGLGLDLQAALNAEGYRAQRAGVVALQGDASASALAQGLARHACDTLLDPAWQQAGLHQRGEASWVILAIPFAPPLPEDEAQVRAEILQRVNQARAQARRCGGQAMGSAPPLQFNDQLHRSAEVHATDMARHGYFSHTGRDGSQVADRASQSGYAWRRIGENLAAGQTTAAAAVQGWLASPSHCANLMQPAYTEMGLAYAVNPHSREGIYWVQVLGTPR